ncbi:MAG: hypothetical protein AUI47_11780 [Acidobacteria bacterium 13_1_40CM_2_68_5]|nr:MAG: hypothetical protein AUI47_11780 [Acidobacteria bacterium 13_1_40CM_2_68_5]OLE67650.1 MAG: hypothetical protein AUG09_01380 [Acidobacteria bacterium 13_1_20CM_2_68_7]
MTPGEAADQYFGAIEEEFVRRRGAAMLLSPRDWSLIGEWKEAGVPLRVVLQGITNVFDSFAGRAPTGRRINSLSYCRQEVQVLHEIYRSLHAVEAGRPAPGGTGAVGAAAMARHLGRLHRRVRLAIAAASLVRRDPMVARLALIAAELKRLRKAIKGGTFDPIGLEDRLRHFDDEMLEAARVSLEPATLAGLEAAAGEALGAAAGRMTPEALEGTRKARLARLLRDFCALPRLTLFD